MLFLSSNDMLYQSSKSFKRRNLTSLVPRIPTDQNGRKRRSREISRQYHDLHVLSSFLFVFCEEGNGRNGSLYADFSHARVWCMSASLWFLIMFYLVCLPCAVSFCAFRHSPLWDHDFVETLHIYLVPSLGYFPTTSMPGNYMVREEAPVLSMQGHSSWRVF